MTSGTGQSPFVWLLSRPCPAPLLHPSLADSSSSVPTSVGANYRAACRARSDFIAKLRIVEEECDESIYWMEMNTSGT